MKLGMRAKIDDYQMVNTLMLRLVGDNIPIVLWQKDQLSSIGDVDRVKLNTNINNIFWNSYSVQINGKGIEQSKLEKDRPLFCFIPELNIIFKTYWERLNPYILTFKIPDSFIDLKKYAHLVTGFDGIEMIKKNFLSHQDQSKKKLIQELKNFNLNESLLPIKHPKTQIETQIETQTHFADKSEIKKINKRFYSRRKAENNLFCSMAKREEGRKSFGKESLYQLYDLSRNGASFLIKEEQFKVGELVQIKVPHLSLNIKAKVVRIADQEGDFSQAKIGVKFLCYSHNI